MTDKNLNLSIQVQAEIILPPVPDKIRITNGTFMDVKDMSENALRKIADAWKKALLEAAGKSSAAPTHENEVGASVSDMEL